MEFSSKFRRAFLVAVLAASTAQASGPHHVVLIVVDGLRPDAIAAAGAPRLQSLLNTGAATLTARAVGIPETMPGHVTIVSGVAPATHGITWDDERDGIRLPATIFTQVHAAGGHASLYVGKSKLVALAAGMADPVHAPESGNRHWELGDSHALADAFARDFRAQPADFVLVHLRQPDFVGHEKGWMSPAYLAAVRHDDEAVGTILDAIAASRAAADTVVLLTADHGGEGTAHRRQDGDVTWRVPFACRGPGIAAGAIGEPVTLLDVAPTVLTILGLPALPHAEGHVVEACVGKH